MSSHEMDLSELSLINDKKLLLKQIFEYQEKGYNLYRKYSISDDINELEFQLGILQYNERKFQIEKRIKQILSFCIKN
jgi:hypothetical protein